MTVKTRVLLTSSADTDILLSKSSEILQRLFYTEKINFKGSNTRSCLLGGSDLENKPDKYSPKR